LPLTAQDGIADSAAAHGFPTEQVDDMGPVEDGFLLEVTRIVMETDTETEEVLDLEVNLTELELEEVGCVEVAELVEMGRLLSVLLEAVEDIEVGAVLVVVVITVVDVTELDD